LTMQHKMTRILGGGEGGVRRFRIDG
jgi:hypothetical protein